MCQRIHQFYFPFFFFIFFRIGSLSGTLEHGTWKCFNFFWKGNRTKVTEMVSFVRKCVFNYYRPEYI